MIFFFSFCLKFKLKGVLNIWKLLTLHKYNLRTLKTFAFFYSMFKIYFIPTKLDFPFFSFLRKILFMHYFFCRYFWILQFKNGRTYRFVLVSKCLYEKLIQFLASEIPVEKFKNLEKQSLRRLLSNVWKWTEIRPISFN